MLRLHDVCWCPRYPWPHGQGVGRCRFGSGTVCADCLESDAGEWRDHGIGPYEFWGAGGVDVRWVWLSSCHEAELLRGWDEDGPVEAEEPEFDDGYDHDRAYDEARDEALTGD